MTAAQAISIPAPFGPMTRETDLIRVPDRPPARGIALDALVVTRAIAAGDRDALGAFYDEWFDRAFSLARRFTGRDESFCLDVAQESMLRAARSIPALSTWPDVERWMARVVYTAALDQLKAHSRRAGRERAAAGAEQAASPDAAAALREEIAALTADLRALHAADAHALGLRFGRGLSHRDAARAAGGTIGALHGRIRRLLAALRVDKGRGGPA